MKLWETYRENTHLRDIHENMWILAFVNGISREYVSVSHRTDTYINLIGQIHINIYRYRCITKYVQLAKMVPCLTGSMKLKQNGISFES